MPSATFYPAASADDGYWHGVSTFNNAGLAFYIGNVSGAPYKSFIRFQGVNVPNGATITEAKVIITSNYNNSNTVCNANVYFIDEDDPGQPSSFNDCENASLTGAVAWNGLAGWSTDEKGADTTTPDLSSILQDIVDRVGWASGQSVIVQIRDNSSDSNAFRQGKTFDASGGAYKAELYVEWAGAETYEKETSEGFGFDDLVDGFSLSQQNAEGLGFSDQFDGMSTSQGTSEGFGFDDAVFGDREALRELSEGFGFSDAFESEREAFRALSDEIGFADAFSAFNWSDWLAANLYRAKVRYYLTITGETDGTTDVEVPIASFQARKRTGEQTYLSVNVPGEDYATQINARTNGELVVEMGYEVDGEVSIREEIIRVGFDRIDLHRGPRNRSMTLSGYATQEYVGKITTIEHPTYRYVTSGRLGFRFAVADPYLVPGDTCRVDDDEFTVDQVVYFISAESASFMEVRE